jgi:hypothetical protein
MRRRHCDGRVRDTHLCSSTAPPPSLPTSDPDICSSPSSPDIHRRTLLRWATPPPSSSRDRDRCLLTRLDIHRRPGRFLIQCTGWSEEEEEEEGTRPCLPQLSLLSPLSLLHRIRHWGHAHSHMDRRHTVRTPPLPRFKIRHIRSRRSATVPLLLTRRRQ